MIALARWLDDQFARANRAGYRLWFGFGAGAVLMAIAMLLPIDRLTGIGLSEGTATGIAAQPIATGASGLPLPRFVSLKSAPANVRVGPSRTHDVAWTFTQSGLPVEIISESDNWRRIRDSQGNEGWIYHALLSGVRMCLYDPWQSERPGVLRVLPEETAAIAAHVENRAVLRVKDCDGLWCRVAADGTDGYVPQEKLWGVYPGERLD